MSLRLSRSAAYAWRRLLAQWAAIGTLGEPGEELARELAAALGEDEVRLSGAFIRMRRAWVLLGVDPSVVERWDAQVDAAHRAHRVLLRAASLLPDVSRPLRVEDYLSPVAAEPRKRARRKGRGLR